MGDGYSRRPLRFPGALIQFQQVPIIPVPLPIPIIFQYNPESITRALAPYNPPIASDKETLSAPNAQPYDPVETFTLNLLLDATDHLETPDTFPHQITVVTGVADRLAALEMLLYPAGKSVIGGLLTSLINAIGGKDTVKPPDPRGAVPVTLFVWGPGRIVPVRITGFSVDEIQYNQLLYPHRAKVAMQMRVITSDEIKKLGSTGYEYTVASFAYDFTKGQKELLALANIANTVESIVLPFL